MADDKPKSKQGRNPNSLANLKKAYGGKGHFDSEGARKAGIISTTKAKNTKKLRDETNRELVKKIFDEDSSEAILARIKELALEGDREMLKLYSRISGMDKTDIEVKKSLRDISKADSDIKRIKADTKRIEAETRLIESRLATGEAVEDDGFITAIESRIEEVWGGDAQE